MTQRHEEVVLIPPTINELEYLPLIADTQYLEPHSSDSLNRKMCGIVNAGVYRGFNVSILGNTMTAKISSGGTYGVAVVERDDYLITVRQQHDISLTIPVGESYAVLEAIYQHGLITKQIDIRSAVDAASIKVISKGKLLAHHVILATFNVPESAVSLTEDMLSFNQRQDGGLNLSQHINGHDPHSQYVRIDAAATDENINTKDKSPKHILLPQLWLAIEKVIGDSNSQKTIGTNEGLKALGNLKDGVQLSLLQATLDKIGGVILSNEINSESEERAATSKAVSLLNTAIAQSLESAKQYSDSAIQSMLNGTDPALLQNLEELLAEFEANDELLDTFVNQLATKVAKTTSITTVGALLGGGPINEGLNLSIQDGNTTQKGAIQLTNATNSTSESLGASAKGLKAVQDNANSKLPKVGGTITGNTKFNDNCKLILGNDSDLAAFFNGANGYLDASSGFKLFMRKGTADRFIFDFETGTLMMTGDLGGLSDKRIKKNITRIENALEKVLLLNGYDYQLKMTDTWHSGVIAQEVKKVLPNVVKTTADGMLSVSYGNMVALLIEAIKEQQLTLVQVKQDFSQELSKANDKIKAQDKRIEKLESIVSKLALAVRAA